MLLTLVVLLFLLFWLIASWSPSSRHNYTGTVRTSQYPSGRIPIRHSETSQAFVVRRDRQPLTKETVETMYHFHVSLKLSNVFKHKGGSLRPPYELTQVTPTSFREFSVKYWTEEATRLEQRRYRHPSVVHRVFSGLVKWK